MRKKLSGLGMALMLALSVAMGGSMLGCGNETDVKPGEEPVYTSDEKFDVGMWVGISDRHVVYDDFGKEVSSRKLSDAEFLEKYREIADAGITIAFPGYDVMIDGRASYNLKALKAAKEVGIKHILGDSTIRDYLWQTKALVEGGIATREQCVEHVKSLLKMYTDSEYYDALYGFMMKDEPDMTLFDTMAFAQSIFNEAAPDLMFYGNLFPVIATGYQLSGTSTSVSYNAYLNSWFDKVGNNYVSYDHYPLYGSLDETSFEASFLYNMDLMREKIREEGKNRKLWTFLQSMSFGGKNRELRSKADASMQAYSFLAYGGDCIQWFCYSCPPPSDGSTAFGNNAPINRDLEKTAAYTYIQQTNADVQALMPYYKNFTWKGVMLGNINDTEDNFSYLEGSPNVLESGKTLTGITGEEDCFAGLFEDKDGNEGYMIVNFTDPGKNLSNKVTLTIKDKGAVVVVKNGVKTTERVKKGKVTLNLACGEGAFVIPY